MIELMKKNEKANITGELCIKIYEIFSEFLKLNETRIMKDFSFLLTQEFMFAARRKETDIYISQKDNEENKILNLNSLAFFFII